MKEKSTLQERMFNELSDPTLFQSAERYGLTYLSEVRERHVYPKEEDLQNLSCFAEPMPEQTGKAQDIIDQLHSVGAPATVAQIGGRYFGFVNGSVIPAGLAAKNLSIFWDQNTAMQVISPVCSKLEVVVQQWLSDLFGFPAGVVAGFVSGTSMANFCGLAAARYRLLKKQGWNISEQGMIGAPQLRIVTSKHAHSTIVKAISLLGFGKANIEWVDTDDQGRIIPESMPVLDSRTILILQAGNVNSGSFDPFYDVCGQAKKAGAWIHVDGAFGLWAGATQRLNHLTKGFEEADSWAVDGHKTLNTPYDSGIVMCNDSEALSTSLHMSAGYIIEGDERDGMFFTPEMSRRSRIIELWATLKYLGKSGVDELVYGLHQKAILFAAQISEIVGFRVRNDVVFNQVIVQCDTDSQTESVMRDIQDQGICWVGGSTWFGQKVIRISICAWTTTDEDIHLAVSSFRQALQKVKHANVTPL